MTEPVTAVPWSGGTLGTDVSAVADRPLPALDLGRAQAKALLEELAQRRQLRRVGERGRAVHYVAERFAAEG